MGTPIVAHAVGDQFNYWTVVSAEPKRSRKGQAKWRVRCVCGTERDIIGADLRNGHSKSCGCAVKPSGRPANRIPDEQHMARFEAKYIPEPNTGCWLWFGQLDTNGYGRFWHGGRAHPAHRWRYERDRGRVPKALHVDHLCNTPICVNPEHLRACTPRENVLRSATGASAVNARKTHCKRGHEFTQENTMVHSFRGNPRRACRACHNARQRELNRTRRLMSRAAENPRGGG